MIWSIKNKIYLRSDGWKVVTEPTNSIAIIWIDYRDNTNIHLDYMTDINKITDSICLSTLKLVH